MLKRFLSFAALALVFAGLNSCSKSENIDNQSLSQEIRDRILALGFSPDGAFASDGGYIVEGDIFLSPDDLYAPADIHSLLVGDEEQYHTTNLVTGMPREITVYIKTTGGQALPASYGDALDIAIARYNAENLNLTFQRVTTAAAGEIDITKGNGNFLASAGFPTSGGNPYGSIKVNSNAIGNGSSDAFKNFVATILAHEMGHCIGFRHTDYMNRSYSCGGSAVNEGASTVGAIHIPGTPTGPDANSWMLACISYLENRPFNNNDKTALDYLY